MKKILLFSFVLLLAIACKKVTKEPYGPTDIRIQNSMDVPMTNVLVTTYDTTFNFGTVAAHSYSAYHRFSRAYYTNINMSGIVNGTRYKSDSVLNYAAYQAYLGMVKATYSVWSDVPGHLKFGITIESPLK